MLFGNILHWLERTEDKIGNMVLILAVELHDSLYDLQVSHSLCLQKIRFRAGNSGLELLLPFKEPTKTVQKEQKSTLTFPFPPEGDPCSSENKSTWFSWAGGSLKIPALVLIWFPGILCSSSLCTSTVPWDKNTKHQCLEPQLTTCQCINLVVKRRKWNSKISDYLVRQEEDRAGWRLEDCGSRQAPALIVNPFYCF